MNQVTQAAPLPTVPAEVHAFAAEQSVTPYLPPLVEMTQRLFPGRWLGVVIDEDPEIANDRHLTLEVDVTGFQAEEMVAAQRRWTSELFQHCPATHVCVFRLGLVTPS